MDTTPLTYNRPALVIDPHRLIERRLLAGMSQAGLADAVQTHQTHISRIEAGSHRPGNEMVTRIAKALGVDPLLIASIETVQRKRPQRRAS